MENAMEHKLMTHNKVLQRTVLALRARPARERQRCRGRDNGRRMASAAYLALRTVQSADRADSKRQSLRLSHPTRLIRRPVRPHCERYDAQA